MSASLSHGTLDQNKTSYLENKNKRYQLNNMRKSLMTELTVNMMEYYSDLALTWDRGGMQCWRSWSGHSLPHHVMPQEPHNTLQWPLELTPLS